MVTFYDSQIQARADAVSRGLRQQVLCFVVQERTVLVFDHADHPEAGVGVPAGGVEPGETPARAAARELFDESGLTLDAPRHLFSFRWADLSVPRLGWEMDAALPALTTTLAPIQETAHD